MKKTLFSILFSLALAASLAGCGGAASSTAAAADALSEEICPRSGMLTRKSHFSRTSRLMPVPSDPMTMQAGPVRSVFHSSFAPSAAVP